MENRKSEYLCQDQKNQISMDRKLKIRVFTQTNPVSRPSLLVLYLFDKHTLREYQEINYPIFWYRHLCLYDWIGKDACTTLKFCL